jgi:HD-like signal output (HDOD) protein
LSTSLLPTEADRTPETVARHQETVVCLSKLPPFHPAVLKLLNISVESDTADRDFESAFGSDPALTADLLLVANSAQFGIRSHVATIRHAISYLGFERVRSLAATIAVSSFVRGIEWNECLRLVWQHNIATGVIAEVLGDLSGVPGLYTAGLIHDLGRLGLSSTDSLSYATEFSAQFSTVEESNRRETLIFGMDHCEAGFLLGKRWGFPTLLLSSMLKHHNPLDDARPLSMVQLACRMAAAIGYPEVHCGEPLPVPDLPVSLRNRPQVSVDSFRERIAARIELIRV